MWQLIINGPGYFDTAYDLPEGVTTLGRADENDIVLSGDLVSRKHARLFNVRDQLSIEDLGSRNGSRVNGKPLTGSSLLREGDSVTVGENTLAIRKPFLTEGRTEMVNPEAGGVRRYGQGLDIDPAVIVSKDVRESVLLRMLDNIRPFDESTINLPEGEARSSPPIAYESLLMLYKTAEILGQAPNLQTFLEYTTDRLMAQVGATTAVVLLRHPSGVMVPAAVRHPGHLEHGEVPVSDAVVEAALTKGAAIAVADVRDDARFAERESVMLYGVDEVLCIPIGHAAPFAGVLYLNKAGSSRDQLEPLLDLCTAVAHLVAAGVEKFQLRERGRGDERLRKALERFHAPDIVDRRMAELGAAGGRTSLEEKTVTVLFADIAGFTELAGRLEPARVVEILNEFYQRMIGVIFSFEGTVDKFLGDAVMALFGTPYTKGDDALRAVRTALALKADWKKAMNRRPPEERTELRVGINTGRVLAGTVGSEARLDYTVIGEPVNVASWVSSGAKPGQILVTGKTLAAIGARFDVIPLGERALPGVRQKIALFEVIEEDVGQRTNPALR